MKFGPSPGTRCVTLIVVLGVLAASVLAASDLAGQVIAGQIVDAQNGAPVGLAAVFLLSADREPLLMRGADVEGRYRVEIPGPGEYHLVVERLGYFENETPLLSVSGAAEYAVDIEMRPEPFRLDPLAVTVTNQKLENFLRLEFGQNPNSIPGYRSIQGIRLEEVKLKAKDNTDLLRWLYIPVSHGRNVCVGVEGAPLPARTGFDRTNAAADAAAADPALDSQCGALYVDGYRCRNEHIEEIVMDNIAVVVTFTFGSAVYIYTRDFDWTFRPGGNAPAC